MSEKSGLEMLAEILYEIKLIRQEMKILDQNIKKVANSAKISEIANKVINTPLKDWARHGTTKGAKVEMANDPSKTIQKKNLRFGFEPQDASKTNQVSPRVRATTECMCEGKMVADYSGKSVPLPGLFVKIFDSKDKLVKQTKTNKAGLWLSKLPVGKYIANVEGKFNGKDLYPVNLTFEVKAGMSKLEVK